MESYFLSQGYCSDYPLLYLLTIYINIYLYFSRDHKELQVPLDLKEREDLQDSPEPRENQDQVVNKAHR